MARHMNWRGESISSMDICNAVKHVSWPSEESETPWLYAFATLHVQTQRYATVYRKVPCVKLHNDSKLCHVIESLSVIM